MYHSSTSPSAQSFPYSLAGIVPDCSPINFVRTHLLSSLSQQMFLRGLDFRQLVTSGPRKQTLRMEFWSQITHQLANNKDSIIGSEWSMVAPAIPWHHIMITNCFILARSMGKEKGMYDIYM